MMQLVGTPLSHFTRKVRIVAAELAIPLDFQTLTAATDGALAWRDARTDPDAAGFDYRDITTICMWQHLGYYGLRPLDAYGRLAARVARFAKRPSVVTSTPLKPRTKMLFCR